MYDIDLLKPDDADENNRMWADEVLATFPEFVEFPVDHIEAARDFAKDAGLTEEQWLRQNLGIELDCETEDCWVQITFWEKLISISTPNFPTAGCAATVDRLWKYVEFFLRQGFSVVDPRSGSPAPPDDARAAVLDGYMSRQELVWTP